MRALRDVVGVAVGVGWLAVSGCMTVEHDLRIEANGSGTYTLNYAIAENAIVQFRAIDILTRDLAASRNEPDLVAPLHPVLKAMLDPREETIRKALARYKTAGVKVKHLAVGVRNAWRRVDLTVAFDDLKKLEDTDFFRVHGFELQREADGGYIFWRRPHANTQHNAAAALDPPAAKQLDPILRGFKTSVRITVPGRIVNSSALRTSLYTASWVFDFDANPNALVALQEQPFRIAFDGSSARLPNVSYAGPLAHLPAE
jgi:hypothetical protein